MAQGRIDEITVANSLLESNQNWSFDTIGAVDTSNHKETNSRAPSENEPDNDDSEHSSASGSSSNYVTPSATPRAIQNQGAEDQQRSEVVDFQENTGVGDDIDNDVVMTDVDEDAQTDAPVGDEWNPTPEELYAIAFADDEDADLAAARAYLEQNRDVTADNGEADIQDHEEDAREEIQNANNIENQRGEDENQMHGEDAREGRQAADGAENQRDENQDQIHEGDAQGARDDAATIEADTNPQPQNPWGMSDAQLEQLIIDQDRLFGYIRDRDSAPKPFSCVCGEASMDPTGFVNLTCPDNCVRCVDCLNANVRVGLESKKNYPPRCCIPIDFENVFFHLEPNLIDRWLDVRPEFEDVAPVYCSVKECSLYLPRDLFIDDGKWALCNKCDVRTCTVCLCPKSQHDNSDACPERLDKMDKDLIKDQGWKACPQCREMIERTEGCDHMICECGQEFCYGCGRSYQPPMPCNCHGQNRWAEEMQAEADPQRQQQILERIANRDEGEEDEEDEDEENEEGEGNEEHQ